jgi:hypothetical protein
MKAAQMASINHMTGDVWRVGCDLERELNAANAIIKQQQLLNEENLRLQDRIKRLEEALNGTVNWIVKLADSGDAGFWDAEEVSEIISARAAFKAKEAKP